MCGLALTFDKLPQLIEESAFLWLHFRPHGPRQLLEELLLLGIQRGGVETPSCAARDG